MVYKDRVFKPWPKRPEEKGERNVHVKKSQNAAEMNKKPRAGLKAFRIVTTEEEFRNLFQQFGAVKEVQLPKSKDPRFPKSIAGFGFVQFGARESARKAVELLNFSQFKGRKIAVDWALNKDDYMSKSVKDEHSALMKVAERFKDEDDVEVKAEDIESESELGKSDAEMDTADEINEVKDDGSDEDEIDEGNDDASHDDDEDDQMDDEGETLPKDEDEDRGKSGDRFVNNGQKRSERRDQAVAEGRVIFLRNLSFGTTDETLKEQMSRFGHVELAVMCKFPGTEQKSGNAFVHFKDKDAADKCLEELEVSGIFLNDRIVEGHRAVSRTEAAKFEVEQKSKTGKDRRNLKLLRASLVRQGTAQARGMSETDEILRKRLIQAAQTKLKNLHMFVSPTRLAIHNIPFTVRDNELYDLCVNNATKKAEIKECRIMCNKKGVDQRGKPIFGKSKGFGFVEFVEHIDALTCLRNLNNNAGVFTDEKRPIVEFSIENINAIRIQQKRREQPQDKDFKKCTTVNPKSAEHQKRTEHMLKKSKSLLVKDGMKTIPKKLGQKVRHRDQKIGTIGKKGRQNPASRNLKSGFKIKKLSKGRVQKKNC